MRRCQAPAATRPRCARRSGARCLVICCRHTGYALSGCLKTATARSTAERCGSNFNKVCLKLPKHECVIGRRRIRRHSNLEGPGAERPSNRGGDGIAGENVLEQFDALASGGKYWTADLARVTRERS